MHQSVCLWLLFHMVHQSFLFLSAKCRKTSQKNHKTQKKFTALISSYTIPIPEFFQRSTLEGLNFGTWVSDCKISDIKDVKTASPNPVSEWVEIVFLFHLIRFISTKYSLYISRFIILFTIHGIASLNSIGYTA